MRTSPNPSIWIISLPWQKTWYATVNYYIGISAATSWNSNRFPAIAHDDRRFLNELAEMVEENLANSDLNVDYLCEQLGVSRIEL